MSEETLSPTIELDPKLFDEKFLSTAKQHLLSGKPFTAAIVDTMIDLGITIHAITNQPTLSIHLDKDYLSHIQQDMEARLKTANAPMTDLLISDHQGDKLPTLQ